MAKAKAKLKRGQPTKYKPEYCQELIDHMAKGYSFESFAGICNVDRDTIYEWAKVQPSFSDAKKRAFEQSRLFWERLGIAGSLGSPNFNATPWIFNMKNRFNWTDRQQIETTHIEPVIVNSPNGDKTEFKIKD